MIRDYLEEYEQRQRKPSTIKQYNNDLRIVMIYILNELDNAPITELTRKDFRRFSLHMTNEMKVSNARANRLMSAVRSMLTYIEDDEDYEYESNVALKVKGLPKAPVKEEDDYFLTFDQIMRLREELIKRGRIQDAVLLMMFADSGARRNEIHQITKYGLLDGNRTNTVVGKRGKEFSLVYLNDTRELIAQYLEQRGEDDIDSLWITGSGGTKREVTYGALYDRIVSIGRVLSELEEEEIAIFPHVFRHSRAQILLDGEDDRLKDKDGKNKKFTLNEIQSLLNHSGIDTTQGYLRDNTDEIVDQMFGI